MARVPSGRKSTIYDIAQLTEASPSTVSLVLNGSWARYRIKEETAHRILEASRRLGYDVNLKARGLRLSRSGLAGMIMPHYRNRFFADLAEAFEVKARALALCPIVVSTQRDAVLEMQVTRTMLAQQVELLFITGVHDPDPLNALCAAGRIPCVNLDLPGAGAPSVVSDNQAGAKRLTERLIGKARAAGHQLETFLFLGGAPGDYATDGRAAGFTEALTQAGCAPTPGMFARCGYAPARASEALARYRAEQGRLPGGLFISSITAFEGVAEYTAGLPRGELGACVASCFDWDPFAARMPFDVTMLRQDVETMVEHAFAALQPAQQEARSLVMVPPVLVGEAHPAFSPA